MSGEAILRTTGPFMSRAAATACFASVASTFASPRWISGRAEGAVIVPASIAPPLIAEAMLPCRRRMTMSLSRTS